MRACVVAGTAIILATVVLCDVTKVKTSEDSVGSLPDHFVRPVEVAKAFLRNRKSTDAILGDKKKRGWEFDNDEEEEDEEEEDDRFRGGVNVGGGYRNRGRSRYPGRVSTLYRSSYRSRYRPHGGSRIRVRTNRRYRITKRR
ncbi:uncharacterized protein LOC124278987 [Haliotis rubra]|uniref:uncharacterized protein LOC124278987 n=1 Tax=Haliotis rubra TaxID=36100 RepID=UPI001EE56EC6|nr:uncharacterized protein LOC124278987 [Haliotis rubra]